MNPDAAEHETNDRGEESASVAPTQALTVGSLASGDRLSSIGLYAVPLIAG